MVEKINGMFIIGSTAVIFYDSDVLKPGGSNWSQGEDDKVGQLNQRTVGYYGIIMLLRRTGLKYKPSTLYNIRGYYFSHRTKFQETSWGKALNGNKITGWLNELITFIPFQCEYWNAFQSFPYSLPSIRPTGVPLSLDLVPVHVMGSWDTSRPN